MVGRSVVSFVYPRISAADRAHNLLELNSVRLSA